MQLFGCVFLWKSFQKMNQICMGPSPIYSRPHDNKVERRKINILAPS